MFNLREGFSVADDTLPGRLMKDPLPDGPAKGEVVTEEQLVRMRTEYFNEMGWDNAGVPLPETLKRVL
jgi:aldehyde:ferredoxin oxidoreductase